MTPILRSYSVLVALHIRRGSVKWTNMRNGRNFSSHFVFLLFCLSSAPASASYSSLTFSDLLSASGVLRRSFGLIPGGIWKHKHTDFQICAAYSINFIF